MPLAPRTDLSLRQQDRLHWLALLTLLTALAFCVDGYHPLSEDGGIYAAAIEKLLHPSLYPARSEFATAYLHLTIFPHTVAAFVRLSHLSLATALLLLHLASLWFLLWAARGVALSCHFSRRAAMSAVALLAAWSSLPIAGTSLLLTDPYLSARSLSTPLCLLAVSLALRPWKQFRWPLRCGLLLFTAAVLHPLAAAQCLALVVLLRVQRHAKCLSRTAALLSSALVAGSILYALSPREGPQAVFASVTRYYWFLPQWHWYELCGLVAPSLILAAFLRYASAGRDPETRTLLRSLLIAGAFAAVFSLLFIHANDPHQLPNRLQPLRFFLFLYIALAMALGAALGALQPKIHLPALLVVLALSAAAFHTAERNTYPHSLAIEWPWNTQQTPNRWQQAFLWARDNTPQTALFALDANYITEPDEDAQFFPAIALRSALADRSKDGGIVANRPSLAPLWASDVTEQTGLSTLDDTTRDARLLPLGVAWIVVRSAATTTHHCPCDNRTVKVCSLLD